MYANVLENIHGAAVLVGGGRDISIRGNLILRADWSIHYDARGREGLLEGGWYGNALAEWTDESVRLREVDMGAPAWKERYPQLSRVKFSLTPPEGVSGFPGGGYPCRFIPSKVRAFGLHSLNLLWEQWISILSAFKRFFRCDAKVSVFHFILSENDIFFADIFIPIGSLYLYNYTGQNRKSGADYAA